MYRVRCFVPGRYACAFIIPLIAVARHPHPLVYSRVFLASFLIRARRGLSHTSLVTHQRLAINEIRCADAPCFESSQIYWSLEHDAKPKMATAFATTRPTVIPPLQSLCGRYSSHPACAPATTAKPDSCMLVCRTRACRVWPIGLQRCSRLCRRVVTCRAGRR